MSNKIKKVVIPSLLVLSALTACGPKPGPGKKQMTIQFWTQFGGAGQNTINPLLEAFSKKEEFSHVKIVHTSQGGYPALKSAVDNSITSRTYPHVVNGYPDHFVTYLNTGTQLALDGWIDKIPNKDEFMADFYEDYMIENQNMVAGKTIALPWNKSTEVMIVNNSYFEVMKSFDSTIKVPETWVELKTVGEKVLALNEEKGFYGKVVIKEGDAYTTAPRPAAGATDEVKAAFKEKVMFDFTETTKENFRVFSWDSLANMFITLVRQYGATYTESNGNLKEGKLKFDKDQKVIQMLTDFQQMYNANIIGTPAIWNESYSSLPFKNSKVVATISSSAGIAQNVPEVAYPFEYEVAPIPYKDADKKFVISQGTNLALTKQGNKEQQDVAFEIIKYLTTEVNDQLAIGASYFPVSRKMQGSELYQEFLNEKVENLSAQDRGVRKVAEFNDNVYMKAENNWIKFTDPAFVGSDDIRKQVEFVFPYLFNDKNTPERAIQRVITNLSAYVE